MVFRLPPREESRSRRRRRPVWIEGLDLALEPRLALSTTSAVVMNSATTSDSHGVTITYNVVTPAPESKPLTFGVYRSAVSTFDGTAIPVGSETIGPGTLDLSGKPADAVGAHTLTIPLANGLPLNPNHPDVLVVANPTDALASGDPKATASFHVDSIVVVSHGGLQLKRYAATGPPWEQIMAYELRHQGYDSVIPFDWVSASSTAGAAAKEGPRLVRSVLAAAAKFPANDVVDIQFIGHSEGAVVNSQAIQQLEANPPASIRAGWIEDTMLDPHAANTGVKGQQYSVANDPLGWLAKAEIDAYQSKAKDPPVTVPAGVDSAQVFYQHTPAALSQGENDNIYNLWGQVPVLGPASYFNLTGDRVTHSGDTAIYVWYTRNIVPTLGDGAPQLAADTLTGMAAGANSAHPHRPVFSGTAAPGSFITVKVANVTNPTKLGAEARAVANADGTWSVTGMPLVNGRYRVVAESLPPLRTSPRLMMIPTDPMGTVVIDA
jgi:hypothetical protein